MAGHKVLAAVVTHNRVMLLKRCLEALVGQTFSNLSILVINNDSTDGTAELLESFDVNVITQSNVGAAGGWKTAIDYFESTDADFIWLMDDDGFPEKNSLEVLMSAVKATDAAVSSVLLVEGTEDKFVFPYPVIDSSDGKPVFLAKRRKFRSLEELKDAGYSVEYPFAHFFNGSLISRNALSLAGNVDINYFIYGEELDFLYRLQNFGAVRTILASRHYHPDVSDRPFGSTKFFYYLKNSIIINWKYHNLFLLRSACCVAIGIARSVLRNGFRVFAFNHIKLIPRAIVDAMRNIFEQG